MTRHNHLFFQNKASTDRKNTKESQKREQNWQYFGSLNFYYEPLYKTKILLKAFKWPYLSLDNSKVHVKC